MGTIQPNGYKRTLLQLLQTLAAVEAWERVCKEWEGKGLHSVLSLAFIALLPGAYRAGRCGQQ